MTIGIILILVALFLVNRIQGLLVGKSAEPDLRASLNELIESDSSIEHLFNTITIQFGPKVMLAAKIRMAEHLTLAQAIDQINAMESRLKQAHPEVGWCFFEPDQHD
jgi:divalent metal cation (Fe/Co/Zn/Cd) transporter